MWLLVRFCFPFVYQFPGGAAWTPFFGCNLLQLVATPPDQEEGSTVLEPVAPGSDVNHDGLFGLHLLHYGEGGAADRGGTFPGFTVLLPIFYRTFPGYSWHTLGILFPPCSCHALALLFSVNSWGTFGAVFPGMVLVWFWSTFPYYSRTTLVLLFPGGLLFHSCLSGRASAVPSLFISQVPLREMQFPKFHFDSVRENLTPRSMRESSWRFDSPLLPVHEVTPPGGSPWGMTGNPRWKPLSRVVID